MATAKETTRETTQTITEYTLTLNPDERAWLADLVRRQALGAMSGSIYNALSHPEPADEKSNPLAVGGKIRILENRHNGADVFPGEIRTVTAAGVHHFWTGCWAFDNDAEGTGWERV